MKRILLFLLIAISSNCIAQRWNGQTLIARSNATSITLIDTAGTVTKTWNFTGTQNGYSCYLMPGGYLWRTVKATTTLTGGGMTGRVQKVDWNGNIVFDFTYSSTTYCLHHDICPLPNGNVLVISYDVKTAADVAAVGGTFAQTAWSEKIMEIQPTGLSTYNVVWEWKVWDHLMQNTNSAITSTYVSSLANNPQLYSLATLTQKDWLHMNGVDYDPNTDLISLSSHNTDEVFIIDHSTTTAQAASHTGGTYGKGGDLLYRWGDANNYGISSAATINVVHDAHFIKNGPRKGGLAFFNNRGISSSASSVDHLILPKVGNSFTVTAGSAYGPSTYSYRLNPTANSSNMSSSEEYPNGNIMVCSATQGWFKEFDSTGTMLWQYTGGTGSMPQAHRYTNCEISGTQPTRPTITVTGTNATITPLTGATYQWYIDGVLQTSATTNNITLGNYGSYQAIVVDSFGCASEISTNYNYWATSISGIEKENISISPNPANNFININFKNNVLNNYSTEIKDVTGKIVLKSGNENKIDIGNLAEGNYILEIKQNNKSIYKSQFNHIK